VEPKGELILNEMLPVPAGYFAEVPSVIKTKLNQQDFVLVRCDIAIRPNYELNYKFFNFLY
jgi:hypothetical protein